MVRSKYSQLSILLLIYSSSLISNAMFDNKEMFCSYFIRFVYKRKEHNELLNGSHTERHIKNTSQEMKSTINIANGENKTLRLNFLPIDQTDSYFFFFFNLCSLWRDFSIFTKKKLENDFMSNSAFPIPKVNIKTTTAAVKESKVLSQTALLASNEKKASLLSIFRSFILYCHPDGYRNESILGLCERKLAIEFTFLKKTNLSISFFNRCFYLIIKISATNFAVMLDARLDGKKNVIHEIALCFSYLTFNLFEILRKKNSFFFLEWAQFFSETSFFTNAVREWIEIVPIQEQEQIFYRMMTALIAISVGSHGFDLNRKH